MKQRDAYWDNLKILLVTLVVIGHFIDPITDNLFARSIFLFIYTFHVPLLVFASGVFYSPRHTGAKALFYVCTGFAMKLLNVLSDRFILCRTPEFSLLGDAAAPWYMFALAAFVLLRRALGERKLWPFLVGGIAVACAAGYDRTVGDTFYLSRVVVFFPFYLAGSVVDRQRFPAQLKKHPAAWLAAGVALLALGWVCRYRIRDVYLYRHLLTGRNPYADAVLPYGALARLGCYAVSAATGLAVMVLTPAKPIPFLSGCGQRTLSVFVWHKLFYHLLVRFTSIGQWFFLGPLGALGYIGTAAALSLLLAGVRLFSAPLDWLRGVCYTLSPSAKSSAAETS